MTLVGWRRTDESEGHSVGRLVRAGTGWLAHGSEVLASGPDVLACWFSVTLDEQWVTNAVEVRALDEYGERSVRLEADGERRWSVDGAPAEELTGCVDVDVAATPLTNTFPIRRLAQLENGASATAPVAWVEVPSLRVLRVEQTYRRLGERHWEYSDPEHGAFELEVDDAGLVVDYAGFATRVGTSRT